MKPATLIWLLVASAVCLPVIVPLLPKLISAVSVIVVLVMLMRVWFMR